MEIANGKVINLKQCVCKCGKKFVCLKAHLGECLECNLRKKLAKNQSN